MWHTPLREATGDLNSGITPDLGFLLQFLFGLTQLAVLIATIITAVAPAIILIKLNPIFGIWLGPTLPGMQKTSMKNNSKVTPEALKEYWKAKSALGTNPSKRQNDPRKYEGSSKTFDTSAKKHESEKKALLAVLADSSKKILERC